MAEQKEQKKHKELEVFVVSVEVLSGKSLSNKDIGGKSDPYCKVIVLDSEKKTKVIENNLNPTWNEKFLFKSFVNPKKINFEVWDEDTANDDALGTAEFDLSEYFHRQSIKPHHGELTLKGVKTGSIRVKVDAKKISPKKLEKLCEKQRKSLIAKTANCDNLQQQNNELKEENESLKDSLSQKQQQIVKLQEEMEKLRQQKQSPPPGSGHSGGVNGNEYRTPIRRTINADNLRESSRSFVDSVKMVIFRLLALWYYILRNYIYGLPIIGFYIDLIVISVGGLLRLGNARNVLEGALTSKRPNKILKLYEFEGDIKCKRVREMLSLLDLDCIIYPCPRPESQSFKSRYRDEAREIGGKLSFPMFVDENYGDDGPLVLYDSNQIIKYLETEYGNNVKLTFLQKLQKSVLSHKYVIYLYQFYIMFVRGLAENGRMTIGETSKPQQLLELYSFEPSPFCVKVREILSSLEIAYVVRNIAGGSTEKRKDFKKRYGKKLAKWRKKLGLIQVPLLIDPNTQKEIFESDDIKKYLLKTYKNA